jgi:hypothetical protein
MRSVLRFIVAFTTFRGPSAEDMGRAVLSAG